MFTLFGIVLLVAGAILTFAVERQVDGVDVQLVGWILMGGGALSVIVAMVRGAGLMTASDGPDEVTDPPTIDRRGPDADRPEEGRRAA